MLVKEVYKLFLNLKDYSFRDQIQRAAISVMSNIAEGYDRGSNCPRNATQRSGSV